MGTYVDVFTTEKDSGSYCSLWRMDSYGAWDAFSGAMKERGDFAGLMEAFASFILDSSDGGKWSRLLSREVTDAAIWGDEA